MSKPKTIPRSKLANDVWRMKYTGTVTILSPRRFRYTGIGWVEEGEALDTDPIAVENDGTPMVMK